jgi:hypothetical protein
MFIKSNHIILAAAGNNGCRFSQHVAGGQALTQLNIEVDANVLISILI